jgi:hypothetical protein
MLAMVMVVVSMMRPVIVVPPAPTTLPAVGEGAGCHGETYGYGKNESGEHDLHGTILEKSEFTPLTLTDLAQRSATRIARAK